MGEEFGMDGNEGNLANIFYLKRGKEKVHSEDLCEYGRIILKWILQNFINGFCLFMLRESVERHSNELCNQLYVP